MATQLLAWQQHITMAEHRFRRHEPPISCRSLALGRASIHVGQIAASRQCWLRQAHGRPHLADCLYPAVSKIFFPHLLVQGIVRQSFNSHCGSFRLWNTCASQKHGIEQASHAYVRSELIMRVSNND